MTNEWKIHDERSVATTIMRIKSFKRRNEIVVLGARPLWVLVYSLCIIALFVFISMLSMLALNKGQLLIIIVCLALSLLSALIALEKLLIDPRRG